MIRFLLLAVAALILSAGTPLPAYAAANLPILNPDFEIVPDPSEHDSRCERGSPLSYGAVLQMIQSLVNASISVGALLLIIVIVYAGALFLFSPVSPGNREMARTVLMNAVIGFVIVLAAWLIVDAIMKALYQPDTVVSEGVKLGPWNGILGEGGEWCVQPMDTKSLFDKNTDLGPNSSLDAGPNSEGGGSCTIQTSDSNPCSVAQLSKNSCYGSRVEEAAKICSKESFGGHPEAVSGTDKLDGGSGPSYSAGLWQTNLTVHKLQGKNCPAAFTAACQDDMLVGPSNPGACKASLKTDAKSQQLYKECIALAQNVEVSQAFACSEYKRRGFQPWAYSANKCNVPLR